jgi:DNA-binding response OmpR family regulator
MDILIIEADDRRAIDIGDYLTRHGNEPDFASDSGLALRLCEAHRYDAVILDPRPPRIDASRLCPRLRSHLGDKTPIVVVRAANATSEPDLGGVPNCVAAGADLPALYDCLESAVHRKRRRLSVLGSGALHLDPEQTAAQCGGETIPLAPTSYRILEILLQSHPAIVPRETIEQAVWPQSPPASEAALRGHVHRLRQLLAEVGGASLIRTVRGVGYQLSDGAAATQDA